jgi:hypothetical protein
VTANFKKTIATAANLADAGPDRWPMITAAARAGRAGVSLAAAVARRPAGRSTSLRWPGTPSMTSLVIVTTEANKPSTPLHLRARPFPTG